MHIGAITTKSLSLQNPPAWATPMCTSRWGHYHLPLGPVPCVGPSPIFFLAFLPLFLYAHTLSDSSNRIRTPRLHYKTDVKTTPPPFSHKLFVICCHTSSFSSGTNSMVLLIEKLQSLVSQNILINNNMNGKKAIVGVLSR